MERASNIFELIKAELDERVFDLISESRDTVNSWGEGDPYFLDKTPLMFALQCGNENVAKRLVLAGADVNAKMPCSKKMSVLNFAVNAFRTVEIVELLLSKGANPNHYDADGWSPLKTAVRIASSNVPQRRDLGVNFVALLLESGASWNLICEPENEDRIASSARDYAEKIRDDLPGELIAMMGS